MNAYVTNWAALGLSAIRGQNAFTCVPPKAIPDTATAPQKRGPKPKVKADQSYKAKVLRDLDNSKPAFNVAIATQKERDRTASIKGRM